MFCAGLQTDAGGGRYSVTFIPPGLTGLLVLGFNGIRHLHRAISTFAIDVELVFANADVDADVDSDVDADVHTDVDADVHTDANVNADANTDANADVDSDADANVDANV